MGVARRRGPPEAQTSLLGAVDPAYLPYPMLGPWRLGASGDTERMTRIVSKVSKDLGVMWRQVSKEQLPAHLSGLLMYLDSTCALWVETPPVNILFRP